MQPDAGSVNREPRRWLAPCIWQEGEEKGRRKPNLDNGSMRGEKKEKKKIRQLVHALNRKLGEKQNQPYHPSSHSKKAEGGEKRGGGKEVGLHLLLCQAFLGEGFPTAMPRKGEKRARLISHPAHKKIQCHRFG